MLPSRQTPPKNQKKCKYDDKCTNAQCTFYHTSRIKCKYGANCNNTNCTFDHPPPISTQHKTTAITTVVKDQPIRPPKKTTPTVVDDRLPKLLPIPCPHDEKCADRECVYEHTNRLKCKFGPECYGIGCTFDHSSLTNPSTFNKRQQNKMKSDSSSKAFEIESDDDSAADDTLSVASDTSSVLSDLSEFSSNDYVLDEITISAVSPQSPKILDTLTTVKSKLKDLGDAAIEIFKMNTAIGKKLSQLQTRRKENATLIESDYSKYVENNRAIKVEEDLLLKQQVNFNTETNKIMHFSNTNVGIKLKAIERELKRATNLFPFYGYRNEIINALNQNDIILIVGQTGSGKSTQIPQYLLEANIIRKKIVCTQPRKVAAQALANRISEEMLCKDSVLIRSNDKRLTVDEWRKNKLMFMTDRSLLNELLKNKLKNYGCIIIDEAHERTVFTDILLCELKNIQKERKQSGDPLKIIVTSATIDETLFSTYFDNCPVIRVPGQLYPVEVYWEKSEEAYVEQSVKKVVNVLTSRNRSAPQNTLSGDILVFLTNPEEIDKACHKLGKMLKNIKSQKSLENIVILPLHGKLKAEEQQKALNPINGKTKVIFSSNIAETSVTINGVTTIIDSGRVKERTFDQNRNISLLKVNFISQSSSKQRKGRAGRTQPGECYNLYTRQEFEQFNISQPAELFRSHLGSVLLQIILHSTKPLSVDSLTKYDLIEKPSPNDIKLQLKKLIDLGFIDNAANRLQISKSGRIASQLYMEPSVSKMIIEGINKGIASDILKVAAITTVSNIVFQISRDRKEKDDISISKISTSQKEGDLYSLYLLFNTFSSKKKDRSEFCKAHFLNFSAFTLALTTLKELEKSIKSLSLKENGGTNNKTAEDKKKIILESIACGLFSNLAYYNGRTKSGEFIYKLQDLNMEACLHPSSVIFSAVENPPPYVLFYELMRTDKLFMKNVTPVDIEVIKKYNPTFDFTVIKQSTKRPYEKLIPKSMISLLKSRGGELIEQLESETGTLVELDESCSMLRLELSENEQKELEPKINKFVEQLRERIKKHIYEFVPRDQNVRALVSSGLEVVNIVTTKEFLRLNFKISTDIKTAEDVKQMFERHGKIWEFIIYPNRTSSQKAEGYVTFVDHQVAKQAYDNMKNESFLQLFPSALSDNVYLEIEEPIPFIQLRFNLAPNKGKGYIEFPSYQSALEASAILGASLGKCKLEHTKLSFFNLPTHFNEFNLFNELHKKNLTYSSIVFHRDECQPGHQLDANMVSTQLHSLFTQFEGLEVMELIPVSEKESKKYIKALVKYKYKKSADLAIATLQGAPFEQGSLQLNYKLDKISLPLTVYETINKNKVVDMVLQNIYYKYKIKVTFNPITRPSSQKGSATGNTGEFKFEMVSILSDYEKAKKELESIISHTTIKVPYSLKTEVQRKLPKIKEDIGKQFPNILLSFDSRSSSIKVFGAQRENAVDSIKKLISTSKIREIKVRNLKAIVGKGGSGYDEIKKCIKGGSVQLNLKTKVIVVDCTESDFGILSRKVEELQNQYSDNGKTVHDCEICYNECNPNHISCCNHVCCQACLSLQVDNFTTESTLLCCNSCEQPLPFMDILGSFDNDAKRLHQACNILLEKHISSSNNRWTYCNTCQNLSRVVGSDNQSYSCIVCDKDYCIKCNRDKHGGPCIDVEKLFDEYKKQFTKNCPKCKKVIEKNGGCLHMSCTCGNHFCWYCGLSDSSSGPIYDHQHRCPRDDRYFNQ